MTYDNAHEYLRCLSRCAECVKRQHKNRWVITYHPFSLPYDVPNHVINSFLEMKWLERKKDLYCFTVKGVKAYFKLNETLGKVFAFREAVEQALFRTLAKDFIREYVTYA